MKYLTTNTNFKLTLLLSVSCISMLFLYGYLYYETKQEEELAYTSSSNQFNNEINALLNLKSGLLKNKINELALWDEHANFISDQKNKLDTDWFDRNISTLIESYGVTYLADYDVNQNIIAEKTSKTFEGEIKIPKDFVPIALQKKYIKFYHVSDNNLFEIYATAIHPRENLKKNSEARGILLIANQLNQNYYEELKQISNSNIQIAEPLEKTTHYPNELISVVSLKDFKGKTIKNLVFKRNFNLNSENSKEIIRIIVLCHLFIFLLIIIFYKKNIYKPLILITKVIQKSNNKDIDKLRKLPGKFGQIGNLFLNKKMQKSNLIAAKEKAEKSDKLKSSFLTNLSHEIRTPMNAIVGFTDLLEDEKLPNEDKLKYIDIIKRNGKNLVFIIDDLIKMSKIDTKQVKPDNTAFYIDNFMLDIEETIAVTIPENSPLSLTLLLPENRLHNKLISDEVKLRQIIINLINNAVKFTEKGHVTFGYTINYKKNFVKFYVSDTGIGIEDKDFETIFSRFHKIQTDKNLDLTGLGLGLSICKAYVKMLKGKIWLKSKKDIGTTFKFTIPLNVEIDIEENFDDTFLEDTNSFNENTTILIAEDNNINFLLCKQILKVKNCNIIRAVNGQEAIDICKTDHSIDLVLMDIKMPIITGIDANRIIKTFKPDLPIIAHTALSTDDDKNLISNEGFVDCITKPIDKEKLLLCIDRVLCQIKI